MHDNLKQALTKRETDEITFCGHTSSLCTIILKSKMVQCVLIQPVILVKYLAVGEVIPFFFRGGGG